MGYPAKLLSPGETIKFETKPHWRALFVPAIVLIATIFGMSLLYFWIDSEMLGGTIIRWIVLAGGVLHPGPLGGRAVPAMDHDGVRLHRPPHHRAIGHRHPSGQGHALAKVNDVSFGVPVMGRILNYGELRIQSAGENEGLTIRDVPDVEDIQRDVYHLIEADEQRRRGGTGEQLPPNANS